MVADWILYFYLAWTRPDLAFQKGDCVAIQDTDASQFQDEWEFTRSWNPQRIEAVGRDSYLTTYVGYPDSGEDFIRFKNAFMYSKIPCTSEPKKEEEHGESK